MKAISIKQPWASLIAHGIKDIENRTWSCPQKYIGQRVLIHVSKTTDENGWEALTREQLFKVGNSRLRTEPSFSVGRERSMELGT